MPDGNGQLSVNTLRAKLEKLAAPRYQLVVEEDEDSPGGWRARFVQIAAGPLGLHPEPYSVNGKDAEQAMARLLHVIDLDNPLHRG